ncbi:putative aldehyde dehydrogenase [Diplodia seriata]|uniref:aldehyde dehydrogenase (NAD(+)) n=1 Tax=Diplodia seriata TaxID=420778 RepID=A0A0G2GRX9_9PEZI|nr:putative aldehyde dehydrogenase [Diplodia seriata]
MHVHTVRLGFLSLLVSVSAARNLHLNDFLHRRGGDDDSSSSTSTISSAAHGSISAVPPDVVTLTGHSTASATDLPDSDDTTVLTTVVNGHTTRITMVDSAAASSDGVVMLTGTGDSPASSTATVTVSSTGGRNGTSAQTTMQTSTASLSDEDASSTAERAAATGGGAEQTQAAAASSTGAAVPLATAALGPAPHCQPISLLTQAARRADHYVDAQSGESFPLYNPADESLLHSAIPIAGQADVDAAVAGAQEAPWRASFPAKRRAAAMHKLADLMEANAAELGRLETLAMGQPPLVSGLMVQWAADTFRYYAGWTDKIAGQAFPAEQDEGGDGAPGTYKIVNNFAWKVAPALAAGNTVVYKPSEKAPLGVLALGALIKEAGFPPGVVQLVSGPGSTGALLASHPRVAKISFTGSAATGRKIQDAATRSNMKRVTLELGGKSPALVFADADLDNAVRQCSLGFLLNSGQVCAAASRTLVQDEVAGVFVERLKAAFEHTARAMRDPSLEGVHPLQLLGPMADRAQFDRVMGFIERAKKTGGSGGEDAAAGTLLTGGGRVGDKGLFVEPTIFVDPKPASEIYTDEIFGPVSTVRTFKTEEEAVALANDTSYGLSATLYTNSISRALRVSGLLEAGTVGVNTSFMPSPTTPFGGVKQSGSGRELGLQGLLAYLDTKTIHINMSV